MNGQPPPLTSQLAAFAARQHALPPDVRSTARRAFVGAMATMLAGSSDTEIGRMWAANRQTAGKPTATIVGRNVQSDPATAALINAASSNVLEFDDTHPATLIHPTAAVLAASLAVAEMRGLSVDTLLDSLAVGSELAVRIGLAAGPEHYTRGWHITATCGTVGAAAGAARLLGLGERQISNAIGIALHQSAGINVNLNHMAKAVGVGNAGRNGLMSALYAEAGMDAAANAIEGPEGFLAATSPDPRPSLALEALGDRWRIVETGIKPYPACVLMHPVLDAVLELYGRGTLSRNDVRRIAVRGNPMLLHRTTSAVPTSGRETKLSILHGVAVAARRGAAGITEFSDAAVHDADVKDFYGKVGVESDPSIPPSGAYAYVEYGDGSSEEAMVEAGRGTEARPLTDDELTAKCLALAETRGPGFPGGAFVDLAWTARTPEDLAALLSMSRGVV